MNGSSDWPTETITSDAQSLHDTDLPSRRGVWLMRPTRPAFVLGSSQRDGDVDGEFCLAHGIDVVRRRSGGGAVHVDPVTSVWVDIVIARTDSLWVDDVGRAMHFVGHVWREVLVDLGMDGVITNKDAHVANDWSKTLCVAGRGTGEVFVGSGAKVVGISQRRTRDLGDGHDDEALHALFRVVRLLLHEARIDHEPIYVGAKARNQNETNERPKTRAY